MTTRLTVIALAASTLCSGCVQAAINGGTAIVDAGAGAINQGAATLRTGFVLLDSVSWSPARDDSTAFLVRGVLTWKKPMIGPNNTTYLDLSSQSSLNGASAASGIVQVELIDANEKVLMTSNATKVTVLDGGKPIQLIPADKSFVFEVLTVSVPWNILRDSKSTRIRLQVLLR